MANAINKFKTVIDPLDNFDCTVDSCNFSALSTRELLSHFRKVHSTTKGINSPCLYSKQCSHVELFKTFSGLDTHLRKFHIEFFEKEEENKSTSSPDFIAAVEHLLPTENSKIQTLQSTSTDDHGD